jgi:hypothetical protein
MIEVLKQALDALESCTPQDTSTGHVIHAWHDEELVNKSITSLRQAIAELESQEPCGWQFFHNGKWHNGMETNNHRANTEAAGVPVRDVYSAPQRTWVGLTDEEIEDLYFDNFSMGELKAFAKAIEAKLKEKNT